LPPWGFRGSSSLGGKNTSMFGQMGGPAVPGIVFR